MAMHNESRGRLADVLKKDFGNIRLHRPGWDDPAMNVLDCVLSLNRQYNAFVMPRLEAFCERHPELVGLAGLGRMIRRYSSPGAFSLTELNYNHAARAVKAAESRIARVSIASHACSRGARDSLTTE